MNKRTRTEISKAPTTQKDRSADSAKKSKKEAVSEHDERRQFTFDQVKSMTVTRAALMFYFAANSKQKDFERAANEKFAGAFIVLVQPSHTDRSGFSYSLYEIVKIHPKTYQAYKFKVPVTAEDGQVTFKPRTFHVGVELRHADGEQRILSTLNFRDTVPTKEQYTKWLEIRQASSAASQSARSSTEQKAYVARIHSSISTTTKKSSPKPSKKSSTLADTEKGEPEKE